MRSMPRRSSGVSGMGLVNAPRPGGGCGPVPGDPASIIVEDREIEGDARLVERAAILEGPHRPMIASGFRERVGDGADAAGQVAAIAIIEAIDHH